MKWRNEKVKKLRGSLVLMLIMAMCIQLVPMNVFASEPMEELANKTGYCTASNNYFAETILTCERNIKKHLQKLKEITI